MLYLGTNGFGVLKAVCSLKLVLNSFLFYSDTNFNGGNKTPTLNPKGFFGQSSHLRFASGVIVYKKDEFLMAGHDYYGVADRTDFLIRLYDKNLTWKYDNFDTGSKLKNMTWLGDLYKRDNNKLIITTAGGYVREYTFNGTSMTYNESTGLYAQQLGWGQGCVKQPVTTEPNKGTILGPNTLWSFKYDGGFWGMGRMGNILMDNVPKNRWSNHGHVVYMKDKNNNLVKCQAQRQHTETTYYSFNKAYLMADSKTRYVGSVSYGGVVRHYVLDDLGTDFDLQIDDTKPAPIGAQIRLASLKDGFLGSGRDNVSIAGRATPSIIKYSTCANFNIKDLPPFKVYYVAPTSTIKIEQSYDYQGAVGTVTYDLKAEVVYGNINGSNVSRVLYNKTNQNPKSAQTLLALKDSFQLGGGQAKIKYTLSIKDSYSTAGVPQSCGQTYELYLVTGPKTDVVAMPYKVGQGADAKVELSFKNIGYADFLNDYKITVYANQIGDANRVTYTYADVLTVNETANIEIPLTTSLANANKLVVQFNDNGDGTQDQFEVDPDQYNYVVQ